MSLRTRPDFRRVLTEHVFETRPVLTTSLHHTLTFTVNLQEGAIRAQCTMRKLRAGLKRLRSLWSFWASDFT